MSKQLNKCENCGSTTVFNPSNQSLWCEHCESSFPIEPTSSNFRKKDLESVGGPATLSKPQILMRCKNCDTIINNQQEDPKCPNCGDVNFAETSVISHNIDTVIPFSFGAQSAKTYFLNYAKRKKMAPRSFRKIKNTDNIFPTYCPAVVFDFDNSYHYTGVGTDYYKDDEGKQRSRHYRFSHTESEHCENVWESFSKDFSGGDLRSLGNFNIHNCTVANQKYLYGIQTLPDSMPFEETFENLKKYKSDENYQKARSKMSSKYDSISNFNCDSTFSNFKYLSCIVPIWKIFYTHKKKRKFALINGSTGKVSCSAPVSILKVLAIIFGAIAIFGGLMALAIYSKM